MRIPSLSCAVLCAGLLGVLTACAPGGDGDGGSADVDDPDTGEGEGEGDPCTVDADCDGEPQCPNGCTCDVGSGFCVPPGQEYTGTPEDGVVCGDTTCALETPCCVALGAGFNVEATCDDGSGCPGALAQEVCDGPEDCGPTQECCIQRSYSSVCVDIGACEVDVDPADGNADGSTVCVTTDDCLDTELCCGLVPGAFELPVDMGVCAPAENNCDPGAGA